MRIKTLIDRSQVCGFRDSKCLTSFRRRDEMFIARDRLKSFRLSEVALPLPRGILSNDARRKGECHATTALFRVVARTSLTFVLSSQGLDPVLVLFCRTQWLSLYYRPLNKVRRRFRKERHP